MWWIGEKTTFENFKKMGREYKKRGVYECETDIRGGFSPSLFVLSLAFIVFSVFVWGYEVMLVTCAITLFVTMAIAIFRWLYGPSVRLERGRLIIKNKDREVAQDIINITARYRLAYRSSILYIMIEGGATLEKQVFYTPYCEGAAFACLINCLKENELEKPENLTLDEFSVIYYKHKAG